MSPSNRHVKMSPSNRHVVINDSVHGHIRLNSKLKRIVDTPQVQRLRRLKQLGMASYVYPGATHTRFAHSLGACYLAGVFMNYLRDNAAKLDNVAKIDDHDIFLVQVAGLCHDLGHGPYSHLFQDLLNENKQSKKTEFKHEELSKDLFDQMVDENDLDDLFSKKDRRFVKELIHSKEKDRKGHPRGHQGKEFMYEIVSNESTGIDVDKFDYFMRDCQALGFTNMFNCHRFMRMARVIKDEKGKTHIGVRDKELENLVIMFQTRFVLHMYAYKHPVVSGLEQMVRDILQAANNFLWIKGKKNRRLFDCRNDPQAYFHLDDSILEQIANFELKGKDAKDSEKVSQVEMAKELNTRINERRIYRFVFKTRKVPVEGKKEEDIKEEIYDHRDRKDPFQRKDLNVQIAKFSYGMKDKDPLENLYVFQQKEPEKRPPRYHQNMVSEMLLPRTFSEKVVRVYNKSDRKKDAKIREAAERWEEAKGKAKSDDSGAHQTQPAVEDQ